MYRQAFPLHEVQIRCRIREHLEELKELVQDLELDDHVAFLPSFTDR